MTASFNSLPQELVNKIIELSIEDEEAVCVLSSDYYETSANYKPRRNILIKLAVVCKRFTKFSQALLWKRMTETDVRKVRKLIEAGFGKDKIVENLKMYFDRDSQLGKNSSFIKFLQGVSAVKALVMLGTTNNTSKCCELPAVSSLTHLESVRFNNELIVNFPPLLHLKQLCLLSTLCDEELENPEHFTSITNLLLQSLQYSATLSTLELIGFSDFRTLNLVLPLFISFSQLIGPNLRSLSILDSNETIFKIILPFCTSLNYLQIQIADLMHRQHHQYFPYLIEVLQLLKPSTPLNTLLIFIYIEELLSCWSAAPWIQLLEIPALRRLKVLHIADYNGEDVRAVDIRGTELERFIEICEGRGIQVLFKVDQCIRIEIELEKQNIYRNRQLELDNLRV